MEVMTLNTIILGFSAIALVGPIARLAWVLIREAFPSKIAIMDENGEELGIISADSVQQTETSELVRLHERVKRSKHVFFEAA